MANSNPANIVKYSRYFKEGFDGYGLDQKVFEAQRDKWILEWKTEMTIQKYLDLGDQILLTGKYEEITFVITFLKSERENYTEIAFDRIGKWFAMVFSTGQAPTYFACWFFQASLSTIL